MPPSSNDIKVLQDGSFKGWKPCIWVKIVQGIQPQKKGKSAFDSACTPDLREDHLRVVVDKTSPNYIQLFQIFPIFAELQSHNSLNASYVEKYTDYRISVHTLQQAANVHKVDTSAIVKFLESLCTKPMDGAACNFLRENAIKAVKDDANSVPGEYQYIEDTVVPTLALELQTTTELRDHQKQALAAVFPLKVPRVALSGVLEMPCGSGKTLTGIAIACKIQKTTLVLCNNSNAVDHWRSEFLRFSNITERGITRATGEIKDEMFKTSGVLITTYPMLAVKEGKSKHSQYLINIVKSRLWGCVLFDEVHHLPASGISSVVANLQGKCKVGLTGTLNREDSKISHLGDLVGPCLYRTTLQFLREQQLVANIVMKQLACEMTPEFLNAYNCIAGKSAHRVRSILSVLSPHKYHTVLALIKKHENQGDKILVFVDNKYEIQEYSKRLNRKFISGDTDKQLRESYFHDFQNTSELRTLLITRTGDESLNLPCANVVIQTSFHHGANNQEMQRLGRILRPKKESNKGPTQPGKVEGVFYSLVSKGTREMIYARKRRKLVKTDVEYIEEDAEVDPSVHFPSAEEQAGLLKAALKLYEHSSYIDETISPHAKKVKLEMELQALEKENKADASSSESESESEDESEKSESEAKNDEPEAAGSSVAEKPSDPPPVIEEPQTKDNGHITGKKRSEPETDNTEKKSEPDTNTTNSLLQLRQAKPQAAAAKKVFVPNIAKGKR